MLATRALTVTTTKLMQNIVWAIMIVVMSLGTPAARNCEARPAPSTTSGVAIGRNNNRLTAPRAPHQSNGNHRSERRCENGCNDPNDNAVAKRFTDRTILHLTYGEPLIEGEPSPRNI